MRKTRAGLMEAACRAGLMPGMAAASASTPIAMVMTGTSRRECGAQMNNSVI